MTADAHDDADKAITALREALAVSEQRMEEQAEHTPYCKQAPMCKTPCGNPDCVEQAEQEPVGYFAYDEEHDIWEELTGPNAPGATTLYAAPVRTKDLRDDEIDKIATDLDEEDPDEGYWRDFARAVIAADREKNK